MQQFLSNGGFAKMMSTIIQAAFVLGIGVILGIEALNNQPFNPYLLSFLGLILGHQATLYTSVQSSGDLINALQAPLPPQASTSTQENTTATQANTVATQANTAAAATQPKLTAVLPPQGVRTNG